MSKTNNVHKWFSNAIAEFATEERGVVALVFALVAPILFGLFFMAYQFDEFNRYVNRVQAAQLAGLEGAVHLPMAAQRKATAENIAKKNMAFIKGGNLPNKLSDRWNQQAWEDMSHLYMATTIGAKIPLHFLAKESFFTVRMRIPLTQSVETIPQATCGANGSGDYASDNGATYSTASFDNYADSVVSCGKPKTINQLLAVPNEQRVLADQMALLNIGLAFFQGGSGGKAMTVKEIQEKYGIKLSNNQTVLLFNYRDNPVDPDASEIATNIKPNETNYPDVFFWLTRDYDSTFEGANANQKRDEYIAQYGDNRFFYSDWMLRDMSTWMNGIPTIDMGKNDNYRSVRGIFQLQGSGDSATIKSVRIRVNRGSSTGKDRDGNDAQSFNRELDLLLTPSAETDLDYVVEWRQYYDGTGLYGVAPTGASAQPGQIHKLYFNKQTGNARNEPSIGSPEP